MNGQPYRVLRRGLARPSDLTASLDALGVGEGEEFVVMARPKPDENRPGGARSTDPSTSRRAALDAEPRTGSQRRAALDAIRSSGQRGMTYYEVEVATGVDGIWKRLSELKQGGWIEVAGQRLVEATGSEADVYVAARPADGEAQAGLFAAPAEEPKPPSPYDVGA